MFFIKSQKWPNTRATFVAKNFQKLPNLVTLITVYLSARSLIVSGLWDTDAISFQDLFCSGYVMCEFFAMETKVCWCCIHWFYVYPDNTSERGSITVQLISSLFCFDSGVMLMLNEQQCYLLCEILTSETGGQMYSDTLSYGDCLRVYLFKKILQNYVKGFCRTENVIFLKLEPILQRLFSTNLLYTIFKHSDWLKILSI